MDDDDPYAPDFDGGSAPVGRPAGRAGRPAGRVGGERPARSADVYYGGAVKVKPGPAPDPDYEPLPAPRRPTPRSRGARGGPIAWLLVLLGLVLLAAAASAWLGLGLRRGLAVPFAIAGAAAATGLPTLAIAGVFSLRARGVAFALWTWPLLVLAGLPLYLPGEAGPALGEGTALLALPLGEDAAANLGEQAEAVGDWLDGVVGARAETDVPAPVAPAWTPSPTPIRTSRIIEPIDEPASAAIVLPVTGGAGTLVVQAEFLGAAGPVSLPVLFDTGATFTTLDRTALARLGIPIPDDAPKANFQTAAGEMVSPMVLVDGVRLSGQQVDHVTVAVCEACRQSEAVGLLGLNVTGLYQVAYDPELSEVTLTPRDSHDRHLDISHWLDIDAVARRWPTGRIEVEVSARNRARQEVSQAVVEVECHDSSFAVQLDRIPARGSQLSKVTLPRGADCGTFKVILRSALW